MEVEARMKRYYVPPSINSQYIPNYNNNSMVPNHHIPNPPSSSVSGVHSPPTSSSGLINRNRMGRTCKLPTVQEIGKILRFSFVCCVLDSLLVLNY